MSGAAPPRKDGAPAALLAAVAALCACLLWAYWTTLAALVHRWANDPQSSGASLI